MNKYKTFTLGGFDSEKDLDLVVNTIKRPIFAEIETTTMKVPKQDGVLLDTYNINGKSFEITVSILEDNSTALWERVKNLNSFFSQMMGSEFLYEFTVSDEPDYVYDVFVSNISEPTEYIENDDSNIYFTITITVPRGYARLREIQTIELTEAVTEVDFDSSAKVNPVFELESSESVINASVVVSDSSTNQDNYISVGTDITEDELLEMQDSKPTKKRFLLDKCNNISSWSQVTSGIKYTSDIKLGTGSLLSNTSDSIIPLKVDTDIGNSKTQKRFYWGSNYQMDGKFYGSCYKKMMVSKLQGDYEIRARFLYNSFYARAKNTVILQFLNEDEKPIIQFRLNDLDGKSIFANAFLLDASSNGIVGKEIYNTNKDSKIVSKNSDKTKYVKLTYKGKYNVTEKIAGVSVEKKEIVKKTLEVLEEYSENNLNLFYGEIRLSRKKANNGKYKYTVELIRLDENQNIIERYGKKTFTDNTDYLGELEVYGYRVYMGGKKISEDDLVTTSARYKENVIALTNISMFVTDEETIPEPILNSGDYLVLDSDKSKVTVNGVDNMGIMTLGSNFLTLSGGKALVTVYPPPSSTLKWKLHFEKRKY